MTPSAIPTTATPPMPTQPAPQLVLRDIHLPQPVSWWPPAPGWWALLLLLLLLIGVGIFAILRHRRRRYQRIALRRLAAMERRLTNDHDTRLLARQLSKLLRHMAVLHYPSRQCAGLYGKRWLLFLDNHFSNDKVDQHPFSSSVGQLLIDSPYQPEHGDDEKQFEQAMALIQLSRRWLKRLPLPPRNGRTR